MDHSTIYTDKLLIKPLSFKDDAFILELVNTEEWLIYIGNRNIYTLADAQHYIQNILNTTNYQYWTVFIKDDLIPIGLISLIKRSYLIHSDYGFAFLPQFCHKGYALESTSALLFNLLIDDNNSTILATTLPNNKSAIKLLGRLGFKMLKEINIDNEHFNLYEINRNSQENSF